MTSTHRAIRVAAATLAMSATAGGTLLGLGAATADAVTPARPYGTVTTTSGVNVRQYPSTDSSVQDTLYYRERVGLDCKVHAQNINGNSVWYKLRGRSQWVTARYVDNTGYVPLCKDKHPNEKNSSEEAARAEG